MKEIWKIVVLRCKKYLILNIFFIESLIKSTKKKLEEKK